MDIFPARQILLRTISSPSTRYGRVIHKNVTPYEFWEEPLNSNNDCVRIVRNLFSIWILLLCAGSSALAQAGRGSISGLVTDSGGALVPGAQVVLLNSATGVEQHSVTSSAGLYTFISLSPGVYQVTVGQTGFQSVIHDKIPVTVDQVSQINIVLTVGAASERVTWKE